MGIHAGPLLGWHAVPGAAGGPRARRPLPLRLCVRLVPPCPWAGCGDGQPLLETLTGQGLKNVLVSVSRLSAQRDLGSTVFRPLLVSPLFFFFFYRQDTRTQKWRVRLPQHPTAGSGYPATPPEPRPLHECLAGREAGWATVLGCQSPGVVGECPSPPADSGAWGSSWERTWSGFVFPSETRL